MDRAYIVPFVVAAALFMENMDSTVIATSLPAIAADLDEDPVILKLAFTSYLLSLAVFIPISGWAADRFGTRTIFRAAILVFTLGSIFCGLSNSLWGLILARALQGVGGAMMVPVGRLVILRMVPKSELVRALGYLTTPALIGPIVGPPLGGFITTYLHWRWIFWVNVPIGVIGIALATLYMPDIKEPTRPLDVKGLLLSGLGLASLIFGATVAGRHVLPTPLVVTLMAVGVALIVTYVRHARRAAHPILDLGLLQIPTFFTSIAGGFLFRCGIGSIPFLLPLMLQLGFGMTPFQSGSLTFMSAAGALAMKATARPAITRFGFRRILIYNALVSAALIALIALIRPGMPYVLIAGLLLVGGFFRSLQFTSLSAIAYADIVRGKMSSATSLVSVNQQIAISTGVALAALVLELARAARGDAALALPDFAWAFLVVATVSALSALVHRRLACDAGSALSGEHHQRQ